MELEIRLCLAVIFFIYNNMKFDNFGVKRPRKVVHDRVQRADLQPVEGRGPNQIAIQKTVIRIDDQQFWPCVSANPEADEIRHFGRQYDYNRLRQTFFQNYRAI